MADISIDAFCHRASVSSTRSGEIDAEDARAHFDRGIAWSRAGAYEQALDAWRQALRLTPDLADVYIALGSVYMTLGCWQEAVRSYQKAILAAPHLLESYYGLGSAYGRLGEYGRAIEAYEQAFKLIPSETGRNTAAVAACLDGTGIGARRRESSVFQDRLRSETEGFDFSALLSSPAERRQAVRQEQAAVVPAAAFETMQPPSENAFRQETYASTTHGSTGFSPVDMDLRAAVVAASVGAAPAVPASQSIRAVSRTAPPRSMLSSALLAALLIVLACIGGRAALSALNEDRDRDAYLAQSLRNAQKPKHFLLKPSSGRGAK